MPLPAAIVPASTLILSTIASAFGQAAADQAKKKAEDTVDAIGNKIKNPLKTGRDVLDASKISLTSYGKTGRISSRVYIDASVAQDPVITDIQKTILTQYAGFILTALQMNQFVTEGKTIQDLLRVVATEDFKDHQDITAVFSSDKHNVSPVAEWKPKSPAQKDEEEEDEDRKAARRKREETDKENARIARKSLDKDTSGKIVSFAGDNHIPSGKLLEVTFTNPNNPDHKITLNLLVQLAPYIVPEQLAVQFIVKDHVPGFFQRLIQWRTGEISFLKDFILNDDIVKKREKLLKLDPSGTFASMMWDQQSSRGKALGNLSLDKADRARNIASSVLIFNQDTVSRAKAECGIDITDESDRNRYFATTFALMIVVVDMLYNQVTFYYNGISDSGTFSFEQLKVSNKGGSSTDLVTVMNALNQGRSPKF